MKKITRLMIFIVVWLLALSGCRRGYDSQLLAVEELMRVDRDSAIAMLARFEERGDTSHLSEPDSHLYQLLRAQSRYYTDIIDTVNPGLEAAGDYFERNKKWRRAGESRLQSSMLKRNAESLTDAIIEAMWSETFFKLSDDSLYLAHSYRQQADCYDEINDLASGETMRQKAIGIYMAIGDTVYFPWENVSLARSLYLQEKYDEAITYAAQVLEIGRKRSHPHLIAQGFRELLECYEANGNDFLAIAAFDSLTKLGKEFILPQDYEKYGMTLLAAGNVDQARKCMDIISESDNSGVLKEALMLHDNDYKGALESIKEMSEYQNKQVDKIWQRDFDSMIREFFSIQSQKKTEEFELEKIRMWFGGAVILTLLIIGIVWAWRRYKNEKEEKESLKDLSSYLRNQVTQWIEINRSKNRLINFEEEEIARLKSENSLISHKSAIELKRLQQEKIVLEEKLQAEKIYKQEKMNLDNNLSGSLEEKGLYRSFQKVQLTELLSHIIDFEVFRTNQNPTKIDGDKILDTLIKSLRSEEGLRKSLLAADTYYNGIITRFNHTFEVFPEDLRRIFVFSVLQLPVPLQVIILEYANQNKLKNRKAYLRKKIRLSGDPNANEYLYFLT